MSKAPGCGNACRSHGQECSFDRFVKIYNLGNAPGSILLAKIVNGGDSDDMLRHQPEALGLNSVAEGFRHLGLEDDHTAIAAWEIVCDALHADARKMLRQTMPNVGFR